MRAEKFVGLHKIAFSLSAVLALICFSVSALAKNCLPPEALFVTAALLAINHVIIAFNKTNDRKTSVVYGIIGFFEAVVAVLFFIYLILQRCGVTL